MFTLNHIIYYLLQLTWGIVQNALGILLFLILTVINPTRKRFIYHGAIVSQWKYPFSMGLGMFIFYGHEKSKIAKEVLVHEYGHTLQSMVLGPLFLFVIAIPSVTWAFVPYFNEYRKKNKVSYVDLYCEKWANDWGEEITKLKAPSRESYMSK